MTEWRPTVLVLGPGGIKGYYEIGVVQSLYQRNILENVTEYVGVSMGSIISLLLCVGFKPEEIIARFIKTDVLSLFQMNNTKTLLSGVSFFNNKPIINILTDALREKIGFIPTLKQIKLITNKSYTAVTLNLTSQSVEYLSASTEPNMLCVDAVALSINIPGVFQKIKHKDNVYIDGALGNPYPIDAFDDGETNILGVSILSRIDSDNTMNYIASVIDCPVFHMQRILRLSASSHVKHIYFDVPSQEFINMDIGIKEKRNMIRYGFNEGEKFYIENITTEEPHMVLKSTFLIDTIENTDETEELKQKEFPSLQELISEAIAHSDDTNKLIDTLHGVLEYMRSTSEEDHTLILEQIMSSTKTNKE